MSPYGKRSNACSFFIWSGRRGSNSLPPPWQGGALPDELRPQWCLRSESNQRHADFQSAALPTELQRRIKPLLQPDMATKKGLEPSTSGVTGRRSNQLNYLARFGGNNRARTCDPLLVRQVLSQLSYAPPRTRFVNGKGYYTKCGSLCQPLFFRKPKNFSVGYLPCAFRPSIMPRSSCASKRCTRSQNWQVSSAPPCSRRISSSSFEPRLSSARCVRSWEQ